jgi:biopolymer transport protein ExbB/TolQ
MITKNKGFFSLQFIVPIASLLFAIFSVAMLYHHVITPRAKDLLRKREVLAAQAGANLTDIMRERPVELVIKDEEPMVEIIFCLWGLLILAFKFWQTSRERALFRHDFVRLQPGERIIPDDALDRYKELKSAVERQSRWRERLLPECLLAALHRFHATSSIQDASNAIRERAELASDHLDSTLGLVRYIAWAIPAIGFIGTVRGIGQSLDNVEQAIGGDITPVTRNLGLAFNSTYVGLMLCIILMFVLHNVQERQESFIIDLQTYCRGKLIDLMKVPSKEEANHAVV